MKNYEINVFYSEEDSGFIANIPQLECCSAFGETPEKAPAEVVVARQIWVEAAIASGKTIPGKESAS